MADSIDTTAIEWRPIPEQPNYEVSEYGHVRRLAGYSRRYPSGGFLKPINNQGYPAYELARRNGKRDFRTAHTIVAIAFLPPCPSPDHEVAHLDGDRSNCHYLNLEWKTRAENCADTIRHGRTTRGEKQAGHRLTEKQVLYIRATYKPRIYTQQRLADELGVHLMTVNQVLTGRSWCWLK